MERLLFGVLRLIPRRAFEHECRTYDVDIILDANPALPDWADVWAAGSILGNTRDESQSED